MLVQKWKLLFRIHGYHQAKVEYTFKAKKDYLAIIPVAARASGGEACEASAKVQGLLAIRPQQEVMSPIWLRDSTPTSEEDQEVLQRPIESERVQPKILKEVEVVGHKEEIQN